MGTQGVENRRFDRSYDRRMAVVELRAERLVAGGDALAREPSGRVVFVEGALPGEVVGARVTAEWRDYARAVVADVIEPSPARTQPPCPFVAAGCGGCSWQHIDPAAQVELKRGIVVEALARTGRLPDAEVRLGPTLDPWAFRTTLRMAVDGEGLAFHAAHAHDLVVVDACLVAHPRLSELLPVARFPGASEVTLRCSAASGERVALVDPSSAERSATLPPDVRVGRRAVFHEDVAGVRLRVSAPSFFQTRADGAAVLVELVDAAVHEGGAPVPATVIDAYAGVGLFAATVATAAEVICIEQSRSCCADAAHNLANRAATIVQGHVERWRPRPADLVIADPSRRGLGRRAIDVLTATGAARLVLVSCDAVALARDAQLLVSAGFAHRCSTVVDLFPHTPHVEVVSQFDRE
jgi:23S rRNA (uracil1939-C5)-methyltransferase